MDGNCAALILFGIGLLWLFVGMLVRLECSNNGYHDGGKHNRRLKRWQYIPAAMLCGPFVLRLFLLTLIA